MQKEKSSKFNFMLLEAVDEALSILGESIKKSVYFHLDETYNIDRHEIPIKISEFSDSLEKMFGVGSRYIEILVIKQFYPKIQLTCDCQTNSLTQGLSFKEYVELMRKEFSKHSLKTKMEFFIEDRGKKQCVAEINRKML
jgi:uncharacterized short protein YbdD (DUF466 family)